MPKRQRQQFSHWLAERRGQRLIHLEQKLLRRMLKHIHSDQTLLLGDSHQAALVDVVKCNRALIAYPLLPQQQRNDFICSDIEALPLLPDSMDLIVMPHILQFSPDPFHALREAYLALKPEGHLVTIGFNPLSLWGLLKLFCHRPPYIGKFHSPLQVKSWLEQLDFVIQQQESYCLLPVLDEKLGRPLFLFEQLNRLFFSIFGGIYVTVAQKQTIKLLFSPPDWSTAEKAMKNGVVKPAGGI